MVNTNLFHSSRGKTPREVTKDEEGNDTRNEAGGLAYVFEAKHALAQYACTGTLSNTYYASDSDQLKKTLDLVAKVNDPKFIGKLAIYARKNAFMKDMPSLLVAVLFARSTSQFLATDPAVPGITKLGHAVEAAAYADTFKTVFPIAIDNQRMLRNFVQIIRSGQLGRKSFGTVGKRAIKEWFADRSADAIFRASVGQSPSLSDVLKMVRPVPKEGAEGLYPYLHGYPEERKATDKQKELRQYYRFVQLPALVMQYEAFKADTKGPVPKVDFRMLSSLKMTSNQWRELALNGGWHFIRMNLNTFQRNGAFEGAKGKAFAVKLAEIIRDKERIVKAKVFPYQLFVAFQHATDIPMELKLALQDAMEIATENVPPLKGETYVFPDVSGSMSCPVTGNRGTASSAVTCTHIAGLVSASILRTSPLAHVIPVDTQLHTGLQLNPRDSVMKNTDKLARCGGGGTDLSLALQHLVQTKAKVDNILFITDNMSWADSYGRRGSGTSSEACWQQIKSRNPGAKIVSLMIQPYGTAQIGDEKDSVLNIGGFSDTVFTVISRFFESDNTDFWVNEIEKVDLGTGD